MSYSICYAMQAFRYPYPTLSHDAKTWFEQQGWAVTDHFFHDFEQRTGVRLPYHEDVFVLVTEFGDSNLYDESGKRARDSWTSHGFLRRFDAIRYLGIRWSEDVESGNMKPGGRWSSAESWIKRIKQQIKQAETVSRVPHYCEKSFYSIDSLSERQQHLLDVLSRIGTKIRYGIGGETQAFRLSLAPLSTFEWWLFSRVTHQMPDVASIIPMINIEWR
ncbi:hypothetical protein LQM11_003967 [Vibrio parahaemolyticus]|nr:hypothetical protein [Vibrio parahaemolyticus]